MNLVNTSPQVSDAGRFQSCERCDAELEHLILGGVGDWRNVILCERCFHQRKGVPIDVINKLAARQWGITVAQAEAAQKEADDRYYAALAEISY